MKLASVTVLYNTNLDELKVNLDSYANRVDLLVLWDNSVVPLDLRWVTHHWSKAILVQHGRNVGLGEAYNQAIEIARQHNCTHLMTMDQDTAFLDFVKFRSWAETQPDNILHCQVGGYHNTDNETETMNVWCQSATIFSLAMLDKIGHFRADYFIGMVDAEIGLRAAHKGYCVMQYNGTDAKHNLSEPITQKIMGHSVFLYNYPPFRHYYESRNRILIAKDYPDDFDRHYIRSFLLNRIRLIVKVTLFEKKRFRKVSAIISGSYQGLRERAKPF